MTKAVTTKNLLAHKAVYSELAINQWTARKLDRKVTHELIEQKGAERDTARVNKLIVPKEALSDIWKVVGEMRRRHRQVTMPWADSHDTRIMPCVIIQEFNLELRGLRIEFEEAVNIFMGRYPELVKKAPARLKGMYDESDFPTPEIVRGKFGFRHDTKFITDKVDIRLDVDEGLLEDIRENMKTQMQLAVQETIREPARRAITVVGKMAEKLKNEDSIFRDSLVENVREIIPLLKAFNLTGDTVLDNLTKRIDKELCKNEPAVLRENEDIREQVAKSAEDIIKQAESLLA